MHPLVHLPKPPPQKILVVDDEQQVCDVLTEALTYMGHEVSTAGDGEDALDKIERSPFNVVITDMDMPRMDGMELINRLVAKLQGIDIIAITGHTMKYKYTDVVAAGAADFITKPFTLNELEAKLNRVVRERLLVEELERLAIRDHLTGLFNRRFFHSVVRKEAIRAMRYRHALFLFFFDIDRFKDYNDQKGHQAGDELLVRFARILETSIREDVDMAFRYGGDEFVALLPHLPEEQAAGVAERIRENYNRLAMTPTTLSIGIAQYRSLGVSVDEDVDDLIRRSDRALYYAKNDLGRDNTHFDE